MKNNNEMKRNNFFSLNFDSAQANSGTYLVVSSIVLSATVLTIPDVHAARFRGYEVVIYEGEPIDYSNREDVIFIDDTPDQSDYSNVVYAPNDTNNKAHTPTNVSDTVANESKSSSVSKPTLPNKIVPIQAKTIAQKANKPVAPVPQIKADGINPKQIEATQILAKKPLDKVDEKFKIDHKKAPNIEAEDPEMLAFYENVLAMERRNSLRKAPSLTKKTNRKKPAKQVAQKTNKSKPNNPQLTLVTSKSNRSQIKKSEVKRTNTKGKDPELVAFYKDVFAKESINLSNQSISSKTLSVKQTPARRIAKKKPIAKKKSNEVQLSLKITKNKDPELVAFYQQVFKKKIKTPAKRAPVVVASKAKDPELVAFYEREFGKGESAPLMPTLSNKISSKVKVAVSTKSKKTSVAKKIAKKVKVKTKRTVNKELAELEKLIGDLTAQNII